MLPAWLKQELERYELVRIFFDGWVCLLRLGFLFACLAGIGWRSCVPFEAQEVSAHTDACEIKV